VLLSAGWREEKQNLHYPAGSPGDDLYAAWIPKSTLTCILL